MVIYFTIFSSSVCVGGRIIIFVPKTVSASWIVLNAQIRKHNTWIHQRVLN